MANTVPEAAADPRNYRIRLTHPFGLFLARKQTDDNRIPRKQSKESNNGRLRTMSNKTNNKEPMTRVEEFRERLTREDLERSWQLEALDHLFTEFEEQPERFHNLWVKPLITAGVSLESALNLVVEAHFRPN
jgi:hypothetical protein